MLRPAVLALALMTPAALATAHDISPVISPEQAAEGIFYRSRMEEQAKRMRASGQGGPQGTAPAPGSPELQKQACANRPRFRKEYGADHPKVQKLESLCNAAGY